MSWVLALELFSLWRLAALVVIPVTGSVETVTGDYRLEYQAHGEAP